MATENANAEGTNNLDKITEHVRSDFTRNDPTGTRGEIFDQWYATLKELSRAEALYETSELIEEQIKATEGGDSEFLGGMRHGLVTARTIVHQKIRSIMDRVIFTEPS